MSKSYALDEAVRAVDLPTLVFDHFPDSKAKPHQAGVYYATWRGNTDTPAFSIFKHQGLWFWSDKANGESGNAFHFLTKIVGMEKQAAAHELMNRAGIAIDSSPDAPQQLGRPVSQEEAAKHAKAPPVAIEALKGRGFVKGDVSRYGILRDDGDAVIPITDHHGVIVAVKRRKASGKIKYMYDTRGVGNPAWCSPGIMDTSTCLVIEGELNAMVAHSVMHEAEWAWATMGAAGAKAELNASALRGKTVYIYSDDDPAGRDAKLKWQEEAREAEAFSVRLLTAHELDFCDFAGEHGRDGLLQHIRELVESSVKVYGPEDRLVSGFSVRELLASADAYIDKMVLNPSGYRELDDYTGGLPDSGIVGIGGLPSMGKSAMLRRMLIEHVRQGGRVALFSPDQSAKSIYRLLATLFSRVPMSELRSERLSPRTLGYWSDLEAARKAWRDTYSWVVQSFSEKFIVVDETELGEIKDQIPSLLDRGVTMFGGDYLQMFEPEDSRGNEISGKAAKDFKKLCRSTDLPFLFTVQLAKYKFPPNRKFGVPTANDIEGSGSIFQNAEQFYMIYNEHIYMNKYAGPDTETLGDGPDVARAYVRKNKEGASDSFYYMLWDPKLVTYRCMMAGPPEDFSDLWAS